MATSTRTTRRRSAVSRKAARRPRATRDTHDVDALDASIAQLIACTLFGRELTQTEAAYIMKDAPSQISLVTTGKLRGFSTKRLLSMLKRLGWDVEVRLTERTINPTREGSVTVSAINAMGERMDASSITHAYKQTRAL
jgi:predicted XRE-type DNA-binding protein